MSRKVSVAVVGTGSVARSAHLPALKAIRSARVIAVCDRDLPAAQSASKVFSIPAFYDDVSKMLDSERIEALHVCTPTTEHLPIAMMAIERGIHTLVEKPMGMSVEECDMMISAALKKNVKLSVCHNLLFDPIFREARRRVRAGQVGDVVTVSVRSQQPRTGLVSRKDHWTHGLPGGVLAETGPHPVYMVLSLLGPPTRVRITAHSNLGLSWAPLDEFRIAFSHEKGFSSISVSHSASTWASSFSIEGTAGALEGDLMGWRLVRRPPRSSRSWNKQLTENIAGTLVAGAGVSSTALRRFLGAARYGHRVLIEGFLESVLSDRPVPVDPKDGRETVRAMGMATAALADPRAAI